jgi:thermitase
VYALALLALTGAALTGASAASGMTAPASGSTMSPHDPSTILVKFADPARADETIAAHGDRHVGGTPTGVDVVKIASGASVEAKVAAYGAEAGVVYAEPNYIAQASLALPNDPSYSTDWGMDKIGVVTGWSDYPGSYVSTGGVPIAIVDTGVQSTHPDLSGRVLTASGANCVNYYGTCASDPAADDNGHGTHVAGIAGAATNNGIGVAGVAFSSPIIPVKVLDSTGSGSYAAITNGITWAVQHGAKVINLSLGGTGYSQTLCDAITSALNNGVLVVAAAGNSGSSVATYPAACPGTVGVAATDSTDSTASWSNYGAPNVFVSAPGVGIYSTYDNSSYATLSGTSMATPFVTGLAALLFSQLSTRTPADVKALLATTSDKVGSVAYGSDPYGTCGACTWNQNYGYGRIDAARALGAAGQGNSTTLTFAVGAGGDDGDVHSSSATYPPSATPVAYSGGSVFTAGRRFAFGSYQVFDALVRFDTSAIPDNATITSATLRVYVTGKADGDNRNLVGDWYPASNWPIDAADYALTPTGSAFSGADITAIKTGATNDFGLSGLDSISKTGYTGLRLQVDGGQPTGDNYVQLAAFENTSLPKAQLIVTYATGAPVNTALPAITGSAQQGQTLTGTSGTWTGNTPITYGDQWSRCDSSGNNCVNIAGATGTTYVPTAADVGSTIRLKVTASNSVGSTVATSAPTSVVISAPVTVTFAVGAGGDDGDVHSSSATYPPSATPVAYSGGSVFTAGRRFAFGSYQVFDALVRFDTSAIPDNATVTSATLRLYATGKADGDNRNLVGDWYSAANWPIDASDYNLNPTGSAFTADITAINTAATNDFALTGLGSISKTGYTGLRLQVDGGQPTADNYVQLASFENGLPKPQLIITYTG